jgi:hypothetical protein
MEPLTFFSYLIEFLFNRLYAPFQQDFTCLKNELLAKVVLNFFLQLLDAKDMALVSHIVSHDSFVNLILFQLKIEEPNTLNLVFKLLLAIANLNSIKIVDAFFCNRAKFILNYICEGVNARNGVQKKYCITIVKTLFDNFIYNKWDVASETNKTVMYALN